MTPDIEDLGSQALELLDTRQRATLTAGGNAWSTRGNAKIGLSPMLMVDGPLGLVSPTFDERESAFLIPGGLALGATWDEDVVRAVGTLLGAQARERGYAAVFAPNLNLARTGLSGRTFEMFSEDAFLTGLLGASFVRGVQSQGVAACPKHLVCNDTETERQSMSATVDQVTLREVYLKPFEMALRDGRAWMVMAAYNRLNGEPCTQNEDLLGVLKGEWGWDGVIVSDYFALKETLGPALAGLDLEMPGPGIFLGEALAGEVDSGRVTQARVDDAATRILRLASRTGALGDRGPREADSLPGPGSTLTDAAAGSMTLVQNDDGLLPLQTSTISRLAVIGPNAARPTYQGATFGRVRPSGTAPTPLEAIRQRFGGASQVVHEVGVPQTAPDTLGSFPVTTPDGQRGIRLEHFIVGEDEDAVRTEVRADSAFVWFGSIPEVGPTTRGGRLRMTAILTPEVTGEYLLGAGGSGAVTLTVDGRSLLHRPAPAPGDLMGQVARAEMTKAPVALTAGVPATIIVEMDSEGARVQSLTVGCVPPQPGDALVRAVDAARSAEVAVLVVGDGVETSRESRDLESSDLPHEQVGLIRAVAAANPRTVVVINAGRPIRAPWADQVASILYAWLPGQAFGAALAKVIAGDSEPSGRMPVSVTYRDEDRSTWGETLDEDLALDYTKTEPVGYRHLHAADVAPQFAFGSGLGYTTWEYGECHLEEATDTVVVSVTNTGKCSGREVAQVYVRGPGERDLRLAGFAGARLDAGDQADVSVHLEQRAFERWDAGDSSWQTPHGLHEIHVGRSSADVRHVLKVEL